MAAGLSLGEAILVVGAALVLRLDGWLEVRELLGLDAWVEVLAVLDMSTIATMLNTPAAMPVQTLYAVLNPPP